MVVIFSPRHRRLTGRGISFSLAGRLDALTVADNVITGLRHGQQGRPYLTSMASMSRGRERIRPFSPDALFPRNGEGARTAANGNAESPYRLNTNSIEAVDVFLSSGDSGMMLVGWREPTSTATYCFPFTA
jgi:hypothetical protein